MLEKVMNKVYQLLVLNLLFIVTSIPIFTLGSALVALFEASSVDPNSTVKTYFSAYKKSFKKANRIGSIFTLLIISVLVSSYLAPSILSLMLLYEVSMTFIMSCKLYFKFEYAHINLVKDAFLMTNGFIIGNIMLIGLAYALLQVSLYVPAVGIFLGFSIWGSVYSSLMEYEIKKTLKNKRGILNDTI
ncbi:DUF624 domain-containing protein [Fusibacter sp. 3D3]|uniref:DUF624 domain-containing protein n=1 Tax=Fusibacter sp. 3D3 TaxID=1048380 RepID=UPI000853B0D6|nr:DUF624 domain-containing protein [Fusibacter sp. 3D3]GAU77299.1 hypothetical protein F3D3_1913 [Fusibacter sp. 3D3]